MKFEYRTLRSAAQQLINERFSVIPNFFFDSMAKSEEFFDLFDAPTMVCPNCSVVVEKEEFESKKEYYCDNCSTHSLGEELCFLYPEVYPGMLGHCWWCSMDWPEVSNHAAKFGFHVWEHDELDGFILSIDGCGYDVIEEHWVPLYQHLGLMWHEYIEFNVDKLNEMNKPTPTFEGAKFLKGAKDRYCTRCGAIRKPHYWLFENRCEVLCQDCINVLKGQL